MKNALDPRSTEIALWSVLCIALAGTIAHQTDWGRNLRPRLPALEYTPTRFEPPVLATLPAVGTTVQQLEMVERPLFVFTRRPPPPGAGPAAPSAMKKGQYKLSGVTIVGQKRIAFLVEIATGKARSVEEGRMLGEITVDSIQPDRIRLTQGGDEEFLVLKVEPSRAAPGSPAAARGTPPPPATAPAQLQPAPAATPPAARPAAPPPAAAGSATAPPPAPNAPNAQAKPGDNAMDFDSVMRRVAASRAAEARTQEQKK